MKSIKIALVMALFLTGCIALLLAIGAFLLYIMENFPIFVSAPVIVFTIFFLACYMAELQGPTG